RCFAFTCGAVRITYEDSREARCIASVSGESETASISRLQNLPGSWLQRFEQWRLRLCHFEVTHSLQDEANACESNATDLAGDGRKKAGCQDCPAAKRERLAGSSSGEGSDL